MKKIIVFVIGLLFITATPCTTFAQFEAGLAGGISIPNLSASGSANNPLNTGYSSRLGPELGLVGEYHLTQLFSIEAKLVYSSQGGKKDGMQAYPTPPEMVGYFQSQQMDAPPYLYANFKSEAKLNYLRIPVLAKLGWDLGHQSKLRFSVAAGPFAGYLVSAKQVTSGNSNLFMDAKGQQSLPVGAQSFDRNTDLMDQLHKGNVGVDGNIGLAYVFGEGKLSRVFLEAGGNYGFVNIQKGTANGKNNTGAATVLLGYTYRFRHI